jgi:hypothetical protein
MIWKRERPECLGDPGAPGFEEMCLNAPTESKDRQCHVLVVHTYIVASATSRGPLIHMQAGPIEVA